MNISVLVITHRKGELLRRSLEAICTQVVPGDEILVIDDGGNDAPVARQFPVRYIAVPHLGYRLASLQNLGIILASHDYIVKFDGDCILQAGCLDAYRQALQPGRLIAGYIAWEYPDGSIRRDWRFTPEGEVSREAYEWEGEYFLPHRVWGGNWGLYRPDVLSLGGFSPEFDGAWGGEESDLGWRYYYAQKEIFFLAGAKVIHQHHPSNPAQSSASRNRQLVMTYRQEYAAGRFPPPLEIPRLDVLVVHLGLRPAQDTLFPCLKALLYPGLPRRFLIVVQEAPKTADSVKILLSGQSYELLEVPKNRGLAWPKAWAQEFSQGWLVTVDDDMIVPKDGLEWLFSALWRSNWGAAVLYSPGLKMGHFNFQERTLKILPAWGHPFVEVDYAGLGCSLVPPTTLENCRFDEEYFVGGVDLDFCLQLHRWGRKVLVITDLQAEHRAIRPPDYRRVRFEKVKESWERIEKKWGLIPQM